jgi:hypothetical protein
MNTILIGGIGNAKGAMSEGGRHAGMRESPINGVMMSVYNSVVF